MDITQINPLNLPSVELENRETLPNTQGIYFAIDSNNQILYIGESKCLNTRWKGENHHRYNQLKVLDKIKLAYMPISETNKLKIIEEKLIQKHQPVLNWKRRKQEKTKYGVRIKLKELRDNHPESPTQRFIGDLLGMTESNYRKMEQNKFDSWKVDYLDKLMKFYKCTWDDILEFIND